MENAIVIKTDLEMIYQQLIGESFTATYQGMYPMPQTGNERYILEIGVKERFRRNTKAIFKHRVGKMWSNGTERNYWA